MQERKMNASNRALSKTGKSLLFCGIMFPVVRSKQRAALTFDTGFYCAARVELRVRLALQLKAKSEKGGGVL